MRHPHAVLAARGRNIVCGRAIGCSHGWNTINDRLDEYAPTTVWSYGPAADSRHRPESERTADSVQSGAIFVVWNQKR